jgi:hypothetical protein
MLVSVLQVVFIYAVIKSSALLRLPLDIPRWLQAIYRKPESDDGLGQGFIPRQAVNLMYQSIGKLHIQPAFLPLWHKQGAIVGALEIVLPLT